ncbi:hypothetical protein HG535_0A01940 [Zygotorulaspora mrakii]|uniref:Uncharacterized protein n=1 Tax=Zygotorulaspora mrakii TaxID=42260 RepID=A0A7H9AVC1_ZYGMR|nr:uncharacterized protein HG535_0A01940 [Zygotorulaspora mrakii]QLG70256.1 hypothetical protein HG535_0A01940 [Zygotorulaspora mrakii]
MNQDGDYRDSIISVFKDGNHSVDDAAIRSLIDQQTSNANEVDVKNCELVLNVYIEFLKLEYFIEKTWDIKTLETSVVVKFESYSGGVDDTKTTFSGSKDDDTFYKDVALKCIRNCEKLSGRLTKCLNSLSNARNYIHSAQARLLEDPVTLLLEIWLTCNKKLKLLRNRIAGIFLRSKLLIIDHELETFREHLSDANIISSYRSFIKIFVEQLQDAEISGDQSMLDECLCVFLDIEAMFNSLHISMLQSQNKSLRDSLLTAEDQDQDHNFDRRDGSPTDFLCDHSRTSSMSTSTDLSCIMERTHLSKELPSLLAAFNNAKRLEQELENVRTVPKHFPLSASASALPPSLSPSNLMGISTEGGLPSTTLFKSKLMMMEQHKNLINQFTPPLSQGKAPLSSSGSGVLSNLYGISRP